MSETSVFTTLSSEELMDINGGAPDYGGAVLTLIGAIIAFFPGMLFVGVCVAIIGIGWALAG